MIKGQVECETFIRMSVMKDEYAIMKAKRLYTSDTCVVVRDGRVVYDPFVNLGTILSVSPVKETVDVEESYQEPVDETIKTTRGGKRARKN